MEMRIKAKSSIKYATAKSKQTRISSRSVSICIRVPCAFSYHRQPAPGFEACKTRACCFEEEGPYSCFGMETDWCTEYAACNQVGFYLPSNMEESEEPPPEVDFSAIDEKCERHYLLSFGSEEWYVIYVYVSSLL